MLGVPGLFMGMAFPLGMKLAAREHPALTPWLWGVNGATSVCASVLAVAIALSQLHLGRVLGRLAGLCGRAGGFRAGGPAGGPASHEGGLSVLTRHWQSGYRA